MLEVSLTWIATPLEVHPDAAKSTVACLENFSSSLVQAAAFCCASTLRVARSMSSCTPHSRQQGCQRLVTALVAKRTLEHLPLTLAHPPHMQVSALVDATGTGQNVTVVPLLTQQDAPNGVAWHNNSLYVAERRRITRYDNADAFALEGQVAASP